MVGEEGGLGLLEAGLRMCRLDLCYHGCSGLVGSFWLLVLLLVTIAVGGLISDVCEPLRSSLEDGCLKMVVLLGG